MGNFMEILFHRKQNCRKFLLIFKFSLGQKYFSVGAISDVRRFFDHWRYIYLPGVSCVNCAVIAFGDKSSSTASCSGMFWCLLAIVWRSEWLVTSKFMSLSCKFSWNSAGGVAGSSSWGISLSWSGTWMYSVFSSSVDSSLAKLKIC